MTVSDPYTKILDNPRFTNKSRNTLQVQDGLRKLRRQILIDGIPEEIAPLRRPAIWKLFLNIKHLSPEQYLSYVSLGPCSVREKIRNDTFRTLATDKGFKNRVREDMLVRLLDAFVWSTSSSSLGSSPTSPTSTFTSAHSAWDHPDQPSFTYVQGMNVLAAPFLYVLPSELEAFACFRKFIALSCPLYVTPTLEGVHRGLRLLDRCLKILDPELFGFLRGKKLGAEIYAFPSVLTLCACTPPLPEVLHLWDFLLSSGLHLNILCVIAQILLIRSEILASPSPMRLLRTFPPLRARKVIALAVMMLRDLPEGVYEELVRHPWERC
ncbi:rab domain-containing cell division control protein [Dacryopinax primogenitus]|uniref:Rab domain-containing cell division control protein n=1 Tax=Dacryopinax primogenitus (strain DJM 731) TaxID=1858805 RepID=M5GAZ2_DACPD|nr:rab domain-containing cell division control protein [Dacryopinax primogenitus]EJU01113.1 rab domain-containing cell division control protein [Dacryopinax primogenitus]